MQIDTWQKIKMKDIVDRIVGGGTPDKSIPEYFKGDIPFLTVKDVNQRRLDHSTDKISFESIRMNINRIIPKDTLIITTRINIGKISRPLFDFAINQDVKALFFNKKVNKTFIEYWFIKNREYISSLGRGTTVKGIQSKDILDLDLLLPDLITQLRIVTFIKETFDYLESMEISLISTRGKLESNLSDTIDYIFSDDLLNRRNPIDKSLKDICQIKVGFAFKSSDFIDDGVALLRGENVKSGYISWRDSKYISLGLSDKYDHLHLEEDDVVLAMDRTLIKSGVKVARITSEDLPSILVQRVALIRSTNLINYNYLYYMLKSARFKDYILKSQKGALIPHISRGNVDRFIVKLIPIEHQVDVCKYLYNLESLTQESISRINTLLDIIDKTKNRVLDVAFSGKYRFDRFLPDEVDSSEDDKDFLGHYAPLDQGVSMSEDLEGVVKKIFTDRNHLDMSFHDLTQLLSNDYSSIKDVVYKLIDSGFIKQEFNFNLEEIRLKRGGE